MILAPFVCNIALRQPDVSGRFMDCLGTAHSIMKRGGDASRALVLLQEAEQIVPKRFDVHLSLASVHFYIFAREYQIITEVYRKKSEMIVTI